MQSIQKQKGITLWGVAIAGFFLVIAAMLTVKILPTVTEFYKVKKDIFAAVERAGPSASKQELMRSFDKFADVDMLEIDSSQLIFRKEGSRWTITADYEKRIHLFANAYLVLDYYATTGTRPRDPKDTRRR